MRVCWSWCGEDSKIDENKIETSKPHSPWNEVLGYSVLTATPEKHAGKVGVLHARSTRSARGGQREQLALDAGHPYSER